MGDTQLKTIEEEVREIRDKEREKENSGPVNEYREEVLPDGTIVRTNKTYSTSEDGSSFFSFQSTSFNSFGDSTDTKTDEGIDVADDTISDIDSPTKEYEDVEEEREEMEDR